MFTRNGVWAIISKINIKAKLHVLKSLRLMVCFMVIAAGVVPCIFLMFGIFDTYEERAVSLRVAEIKTQGEMIANQTGMSQYLVEPSEEVINAQIAQLANYFDGRVEVVDNNFVVIKDTYALSTGKTMVSEEVIRCYLGDEDYYYDPDNSYIQQTISIEDSVTKETIGVMIISISTESIVESLDILNRKAALLVMLIGVVMIGIAFFVSYLLVKPFAKISRQIEGLSEGFTDEAIRITDYKEMEMITDSINKMISRMKVLDDSRQEFVSNVSHELKTPITSMKVLADSLLMQEDVPIELYHEFMRDIADEIDRESKIIDDLLSLVKMDKTSQDMNIQAVDINELLEMILRRLRPIAAKRNIELLLESFRPVTAEVDEVKITLAISNLVENAIKYNVDNGWVHVSLNADHKFFYVTVEDSGVGIPLEAQEHIFERFYRVDKSHSREIGGTGLGLAITRNAILMHRGTIQVSSVEGNGTTFTIRIPLNYIV